MLNSFIVIFLVDYVRRIVDILEKIDNAMMVLHCVKLDYNLSYHIARQMIDLLSTCSKIPFLLSFIATQYQVWLLQRLHLIIIGIPIRNENNQLHTCKQSPACTISMWINATLYPINSCKCMVHTQHCDYWCPGAKAPGHQYPQCWGNIYYNRQAWCKNISKHH